MKAYKHLVKFAIAQNHTVSVWDGEEWQVSKSISYKAIIGAIESVEEAQIRIVCPLINKEVGWALVIPFGMEEEETVADYSITPLMESWEKSYNLTMAKKYA